MAIKLLVKAVIASIAFVVIHHHTNHDVRVSTVVNANAVAVEEEVVVQTTTTTKENNNNDEFIMQFVDYTIPKNDNADQDWVHLNDFTRGGKDYQEIRNKCLPVNEEDKKTIDNYEELLEVVRLFDDQYGVEEEEEEEEVVEDENEDENDEKSTTEEKEAVEEEEEEEEEDMEMIIKKTYAFLRVTEYGAFHKSSQWTDVQFMAFIQDYQYQYSIISEKNKADIVKRTCLPLFHRLNHILKAYELRRARKYRNSLPKVFTNVTRALTSNGTEIDIHYDINVNTAQEHLFLKTEQDFAIRARYLSDYVKNAPNTLNGKHIVRNEIRAYAGVNIGDISDPNGEYQYALRTKNLVRQLQVNLLAAEYYVAWYPSWEQANFYLQKVFELMPTCEYGLLMQKQAEINKATLHPKYGEMWDYIRETTFYNIGSKVNPLPIEQGNEMACNTVKNYFGRFYTLHKAGEALTEGILALECLLDRPYVSQANFTDIKKLTDQLDFALGTYGKNMMTRFKIQVDIEEKKLHDLSNTRYEDDRIIPAVGKEYVTLRDEFVLDIMGLSKKNYLFNYDLYDVTQNTVEQYQAEKNLAAVKFECILVAEHDLFFSNKTENAREFLDFIFTYDPDFPLARMLYDYSIKLDKLIELNTLRTRIDAMSKKRLNFAGADYDEVRAKYSTDLEFIESTTKVAELERKVIQEFTVGGNVQKELKSLIDECIQIIEFYLFLDTNYVKARNFLSIFDKIDNTHPVLARLVNAINILDAAAHTEEYISLRSKYITGNAPMLIDLEEAEMAQRTAVAASADGQTEIAVIMELLIAEFAYFLGREDPSVIQMGDAALERAFDMDPQNILGRRIQYLFTEMEELQEKRQLLIDGETVIEEEEEKEESTTTNEEEEEEDLNKDKKYWELRRVYFEDGKGGVLAPIVEEKLAKQVNDLGRYYYENSRTSDALRTDLLLVEYQIFMKADFDSADKLLRRVNSYFPEDLLAAKLKSVLKDSRANQSQKKFQGLIKDMQKTLSSTSDILKLEAIIEDLVTPSEIALAKLLVGLGKGDTKQFTYLSDAVSFYQQHPATVFNVFSPIAMPVLGASAIQSTSRCDTAIASLNGKKASQVIFDSYSDVADNISKYSPGIYHLVTSTYTKYMLDCNKKTDNLKEATRVIDQYIEYLELEQDVSIKNIPSEIALLYANVLLESGRAEQAIRIAEDNVELSVKTSELYPFLIRAYDRISNFDRVMELQTVLTTLKEASTNQLNQRKVHMDKRFVSDAIANIEPAVFSALPRAATQQCTSTDKECSVVEEPVKPIVIVGLPSSGTTLLEKMLDVHDEVSGVGKTDFLSDLRRELTIESLAHGGQSELIPQTSLFNFFSSYDAVLSQEKVNSYAKRFESSINDITNQMNMTSHSRVVLKQNFDFMNLDFLTLISPSSYIIEVEREWRDLAVYNFLQKFLDNDKELYYAQTFENMKVFFSLYQEIMNFWRTELGLNILTIKYEDLINDSEKTLKKVVDFVDLKWEPEMLKYSKLSDKVPSSESLLGDEDQSSVGKWKSYENHVPLNLFAQKA